MTAALRLALSAAPAAPSAARRIASSAAPLFSAAPSPSAPDSDTLRAHMDTHPPAPLFLDRSAPSLIDPSRIARFDLLNPLSSSPSVSVNLHQNTPIVSISRKLSLNDVPTYPDIKNAWWKYPYVQTWLRAFTTGAYAGLLELDRSVFATAPRSDILAQVLKYERDWREQGTESTKSLSQVRGSTRKVFPQKGRGKARVRTMRAPHFVGGYNAHGPRPHNKATDIPRKVYDLGIRTALSTKFAQDQLIIVDHLSSDTTNKEVLRERLRALGISGTKTCFFYGDSAIAPEPLIHVMDTFNRALPTQHVPEGERALLIASAKHVSVTILLEHEYVVIDKQALEVLEEMYRLDH